MVHITHLPNRAVLAISGTDRVSFLQGLVSNDVTLAAPGRAVFAALLSPQGKWLADFFLFADGDRLLLEGDAAQLPALATKLRRFKLRADVAITDTNLAVFAAWGAPVAAPVGAIMAPDPRLAQAGVRILAPTGLPASATPADYDVHRLSLGLPDGSRDLIADKTILLEAGFDELNGISWTKGCYMGQELTARTRYRGLIKRRLVPVTGVAGLPPPGTPIVDGAGRDVGDMRSAAGTLGLASLRIDALAANLSSAGAALSVHMPSWLRLPAKDAPHPTP